MNNTQRTSNNSNPAKGSSSSDRQTRLWHRLALDVSCGMRAQGVTQDVVSEIEKPGKVMQVINLLS